ncbi:serine/threonine protein kinase [Nocardiopsis exhalans]|uniref:non-specific serine/threonine protein kinase n=1 Tax=Nocardiopsis exhalans TaxID=163604 RepID=A0ABY5DFT0_9ACTN|nr:serine/threonine-protein kinase [Nocardiopsis exhalans]USY21957.1 serine/threonine protein kinase [Nocardiopsis exhalans]
MTSSAKNNPRVVADRYEIRGELGRGGMGAVWYSWDRVLGREVALKEMILPPGTPEEQRSTFHARMRREARSAGRLADEPGVVTVHDILDVDGDPWVVMQLVRGRSLREEVARHGPVPVAEAARVAQAVLEALRSAHARGIVHRDVKPGNIMLADDGRVLLADFGIATIAGEDEVTRDGSRMGSAPYMAPERLRGRGPAEPPSDLWALGAALYTVVEGRHPFLRDEVGQTIAAVLSEPAPPPTRAGALAPLITALLEHDPGQRPTAEAALALLRGGPRPVEAPTRPADPGPPQEDTGRGPMAVGRSGIRGRTLIAVGAAVAALVLVTALGAYLLSPDRLSVEYDRYSADGFLVDYPRGWEQEVRGDEPHALSDWGSVSFVPPEETEEFPETLMSAGWYSDPEHEDVVTESLEGWESAMDELDVSDRTQRMLDADDFTDLPRSWDATVFEDTYTGFENTALDMDWDQDPDRFSIALQIHVSDGEGTTAYWIAWYGPQSERRAYDDVIRDTIASFTPRE